MRFSASGKLLLFGEYLVLRGAKSLALPVKFGQKLTINKNSSENILWECFEKDRFWLKIELSSGLEVLHTEDPSKALIVQKLLKLIAEKKPELKITGLHFRFDIDFDRNYGLGTSSTLISLLSQWSGVDPYFLLKNSFGGSGFDVAAATAAGPVLYSTGGLDETSVREVKPVQLHPAVTTKILFVYTGRKQTSRQEVISFSKTSVTSQQIEEMNTIVDDVLRCNNIERFELLMQQSEKLLSGILNTPTVKEGSFADYPFAIKSLGAWGGDFIMAAFRDEADAKDYFSKKGLYPIFNHSEIIRHG